MQKEIREALQKSLTTINEQDNMRLAETLVAKGERVFSLSYDHLTKIEKRFIAKGVSLAIQQAVNMDSTKDQLDLSLMILLLDDGKVTQLSDEVVKYIDLIVAMIGENDMKKYTIPIMLALAFTLEVDYGKG